MVYIVDAAPEAAKALCTAVADALQASARSEHTKARKHGRARRAFLTTALVYAQSTRTHTRNAFLHTPRFWQAELARVL